KFVFNGYYASMPAETAVGRLIWSNSVNGLSSVDSQSISLYPNPVQDILSIQSDEASLAEIRNIQGELIRVVEISSGTTVISVEELPSGMYFLQAKNARSTSIRSVIQ